MDIKFDATETTSLYRHFTGQNSPQTAYISIDYRDLSIDADWDMSIGGGVPFYVWHGTIERITIDPRVKTESLEEFLHSDFFADAVAELARIKVEGEDEGQQREQIRAEISYRVREDVDHINVWSAADWLEGGTRYETGRVIVNSYTITARSTDDELSDLAAGLVLEMENGDLLDDCLVEYLESLREGLLSS